MSQISTTSLKKINLGDRIDAEYFQPAYLTIEQNIKKHNFEVLGNLCKIDASAFYPAATELYSIGEIPFARCVDCVNFPFVDNNRYDEFEKIPKYFLDENINSIKTLKENEIIITKVGTPCFASIISDYELMALSRTVLGLSNITINPYYLMIFLRSYYGFSQLQRERELTIQYQLTLDRVGRILIPLLSTDFQYQIEKIAKESHKKECVSKQLYQKAEDLLLTELGLKGHTFTHTLTFSTTKKEVDNAGRYDADYFQPKYDELIEKIENYKGGWEQLVNLTTYINNGNQPPYSESGDIRFFSQKWIKDKGIDYSFLESTEEPMVESLFFDEEKNKQSLVSKGDILYYSVGANLGYCHTYLADEKIAVGSFINIIRTDTSKFDSIAMGVILNSMIGRMQADRDKSGVAQPYIYAKNLRKFKIPLINPQLQKEISDKIKESFKLRNESKQLLEQAKKMVEDEIEKE